jgi:c-di-GMP-binding flagellar brake protein YcgR
MDTMPMGLDTLNGSGSGLDEFRISSPREIGAMLKRLVDANAVLNLNGSNGGVVAATLWTLDSSRGTLGFSAEMNDPNLPALLECDEAVVVGYLDNVKVQFDVTGLVLVRGAYTGTINCAYPQELYRFQRRNAYRVRPVLRGTPTARVRHSEIADMQLALRVLDISIGGCALFLPNDVPALQPGVLLNQVLIELDADTRFHANLRLQHVSSFQADAQGVRLGCEFVNASSDAERSLQRFIDNTQKRTRLLRLD